jgi:hypothetical protein
MPATRYTARHVEAQEGHGALVRVFVAEVEEVAADGAVDAAERRRVALLAGRVVKSADRRTAEASVIADALGLVGTLLGTCRVTPWVARRLRESTRDAENLAAEGLLAP